MVTFVTKPQIEQLVGTKIKNLDLYQKAFTHKSALKEYEQLNESFETLEFIGDSVLGFVITKFLFDQYESKQEGFLTKARTKLVRGETLANIAKILGLEKMVVMDEKGMRNGWNNNPKILEDVFLKPNRWTSSFDRGEGVGSRTNANCRSQKLSCGPTPEGPPRALQASECNELLDPTRTSYMILVQRQPGKFIQRILVTVCS